LDFPKIANSTSNDSPIFIEYISSPTSSHRSGGGYSGAYVIKAGSRFYRTVVKCLNKTTINLACQKRIKRNCKFRANLKILNIFEPTMAGFHDPSNFILIPSKGLESHTCDGYATIYEAREPVPRDQPTKRDFLPLT